MADDVLLTPPDAAESALLVRGFVAAAAGPDGLTEIQRLLFESITRAMTGHRVDAAAAAPITPAELAAGLRRRNAAFRGRIVQIMVLGEMVLNPLPPEVGRRVEEFADALDVADDMVAVARSYAGGSLGLAAVDFDRNGYLEGVTGASALHTSSALQQAWASAPDDPALAARWRSLAALPAGTVGRGVHDFYLARGFAFPGEPGSAPPLLAQHDWVHVVADYGTTVENEIEVFGLIARANDDPRAFSLLAMVVSLFESGNLAAGAGLFAADTGHLSRAGMADRLADALLRGALCRGSTDLLAQDWFAVADRPVAVVRAELGLPPKSATALAAGSVGPWEAGGISPYQLGSGRRLAAAQGRPYDAFGATT